MSEASALERWAFLGRPPPTPNRVTLIARADEPDGGEHRPFPHVDDEAFETGRPAEHVDDIARLLEGLAPAVPIDRLLEDLASGHVPDVGKGDEL